jgi:hypothetical protein
MSLVHRLGVGILLAGVILLPLYELADYTEAWQQDGDFVLPGLVALVTGMALLGRNFSRLAFVVIFAFIRIAAALLLKRYGLSQIRRDVSVSPPASTLPIVFCDLRI